MKKYLPDCFWPSSKNGSYVSHEAICILNDYDHPVTVNITLLFEDRDKMDGFSYEVGAERTLHIRMDRAVSAKGETVPQDTPYAAIVTCDYDVPVQYTRVDTTQPELALMTAII